MLVLAGFSIVLTVFILILFHKPGRPRQNSLIIAFTRLAAKSICWRVPNTTRKLRCENKDGSRVRPIELTDMDEKAHVVNRADTCSISSCDGDDDVTWERVALILDRFSFYSFFTVNLVMNITFVTVLATGDDTVKTAH